MRYGTLIGTSLLVATAAAPTVRGERAERPRPEDQAATIDEEAVSNQALKIAEERYAAARQQLLTTRAKLHDLTGLADVSFGAIMTATRALDAQYESLQLDEVGANARRQALAEAIAEYGKKTEMIAKSDPAVSELEKLVALQERSVARSQQMYKQGTLAQGELDTAQAALSEARVKLAERQQSAASALGGDALALWNRDLVNLTVAEAERRAKLEYASRKLKNLEQAMEMSDDLVRQEAACNSADSALVTARNVVEGRAAQKAASGHQ